MKRFKCVECDEYLTVDEMDRWYSESEHCCSGYHCGCEGLPLDPPICDECNKKLEG